MVGTKLPESREEQDEAYNPGRLHAAEQFGGQYASHGLDQLESFANDPANASKKSEGETTTKDPSANIQKAKEAESQGQQTPWANKTTPGGSSKKQALTIKGVLKKKGPIGVLLLLIGGGGFAAYTGPFAAVLMPNLSARSAYGNVEKVGVSNWKQSLKYAIGNQKACEGKPKSKACQWATSTDKTIEKFKEQQFKEIDTTPIKDADGKPTGRHIINSITFPDGTKVTDGDAFVKHIDSSVGAASKAFAVFNPRSGPYVGRNFALKILKKFGIAKNKIVIDGKDKESVARSFNKEAGVPEETESKTKVEADTAATEGELKVKGAKIGDKVTNVAGLACGFYDLARGGINLVKFKNALRYVAFGWLFFKLYDQIRAGDADAATIAAAATVLTTPETSGENKGKTALDSPGFQAMMYGDKNKLSSASQNILLSGNPALIKLDNALIDIKDLAGKGTIHKGCKVANNFFLGAGLTAAMCGAGGAAGGTVVPILGNVVGGVGGVALCTLGNVVIGEVSGVIIGKIISELMPSLGKFLAKANPSFSMPGVGAGNAIAIAGAILFGNTGLANGMKLATKAEALDFNKVTYDDQRQYEEIARYDARSTPLDMTNQYSFMSQFVSKLGITGSSSNPIASMLTSMGSVLSNAPSTLVSTSFALDMPSPIKEDTLGECTDPELAEKNLGCDAMGSPLTVMSKAEMTRPSADVLKYMKDNNYTDEDGTVNPDKDYAKYLQYCTGQEPTLPGNSALSIDDDDYDWPDTICQLSYEKEPNNEQAKMVSYFRTYTFRDNQKDDEDTAYTAEAANAGNGGGGGAAAPTDQTGGTTTGADIDGDDYKAECSKYAYCTKQCVDFVLFRLVKHGVLPGKQKLGNGKDVVGTLGGLGFKVDTTPAVHAVMSTSHTSHPSLGHTAIVSQVNADGSIVVEEYNYAKPLKYSTRTITAAQIKADGMTFAHTESKYK